MLFDHFFFPVLQLNNQLLLFGCRRTNVSKVVDFRITTRMFARVVLDVIDTYIDIQHFPLPKSNNPVEGLKIHPKKQMLWDQIDPLKGTYCSNLKK